MSDEGKLREVHSLLEAAQEQFRPAYHGLLEAAQDAYQGVLEEYQRRGLLAGPLARLAEDCRQATRLFSEYVDNYDAEVERAKEQQLPWRECEEACGRFSRVLKLVAAAEQGDLGGTLQYLRFLGEASNYVDTMLFQVSPLPPEIPRQVIDPQGQKLTDF
jgi:hypothetical protein